LGFSRGTKNLCYYIGQIVKKNNNKIIERTKRQKTKKVAILSHPEAMIRRKKGRWAVKQGKKDGGSSRLEVAILGKIPL
jgi:hypothetical protein